jgi:hypothetical protein
LSCSNQGDVGMKDEKFLIIIQAGPEDIGKAFHGLT